MQNYLVKNQALKNRNFYSWRLTGNSETGQSGGKGKMSGFRMIYLYYGGDFPRVVCRKFHKQVGRGRFQPVLGDKYPRSLAGPKRRGTIFYQPRADGGRRGNRQPALLAHSCRGRDTGLLERSETVSSPCARRASGLSERSCPSIGARFST